jgi:DNA-binding response OmpR family regulator
MLKRYRILLVDEDSRIRNSLYAELTNAGYEVINGNIGSEVIERIQAQEPDMLILDILMPRLNGFEILKTIREIFTKPVILLSSQTAEITRIKGLNLGADDYLTKPFNTDELIARIEAIRRRVTPVENTFTSTILTIGNISIDFKKKSVCINSREIQLTLIEWKLLIELSENRGRLIQYDQLLSNVWGTEYCDDIQLLRTWISRLRDKLTSDSHKQPIRTIRNIGYILD